MIGQIGSDPASEVILLLCAPITGGRTLGPSTFVKLRDRVQERSPGGLGSLLGSSESALVERFDLPAETAGVVASLLSRGGTLGIELERLAARGIWTLTLADEAYPIRLSRLKHLAPPVLFGTGDRALLERGGVAIVGSRDADARAIEWTEALASTLAAGGTQVVSGAARGVDAAAMRGAAQAGGSVIGILADSLERRVREPETRQMVGDGQVVLVTPWSPGAGFKAGAAMGRNKLIYALADAAVVVATAEGSGGTWTGAVEALEAAWVPVHVRVGDDTLAGNASLVARGARALAWHAGEDEPALLDRGVLRVAESAAPDLLQSTLFGVEERVQMPRAKAYVKKKATKLGPEGPASTSQVEG